MAGELAGVDYSDATPDLAYSYNRLGQRGEISDGAGTHTFTYSDAGLPDVEAHTAGPLAGWAVDHDYDTLHRRTDLKVKQGETVRTATHFTYDDASRFHTIGDGTRTATYAYLTNRGLVKHATFHRGTADAMRTASLCLVSVGGWGACGGGWGRLP